MAFMRYAKAVLIQPHVSQRGWGRVRKTAASPSRNIVTQASEILGKPFNPDDYLLTHSTIVASVDVDTVPNVKLGRVKIGKGRTVNRKYGDYYIRPDCSKYVNNNGDSWSRQVLLAAYPTFIGAHNFLEHVQLEEQSKGRIIDAVARDIGDSVYVDILVATDRRHTQLVRDIESGKMGTLSMGCSVEETICTKCGNVAVDEVDLCPCIKYEKMNRFLDDQGQHRIVAELCGHPDIEDHGGVHFIEASWVATPAFTGAVIRNILEPTSLPESMARRVQAVLGSIPPEWDGSKRVVSAALGVDPGGRDRTAVAVVSMDGNRVSFDFGDGEGDGGEEPKEEAKSPIQELEDQVLDAVTQSVVKRVKEDLRKDTEAEALSPEDSTVWENDTVVKEGYAGAVRALTKRASSDAEFVDGLASVNHAFGVRISRDIYRAALKVGPASSYPNLSRFLAACHSAVGRQVTPADVRAFVRIGKLLDSLGSSTLRHREGDIR